MFRCKAFTLLVFGLLSISVMAETVEVEVVQPESETLVQTLELTGSVEAKQDADLAVQQAGLIESLYVDIGDTVSKGQKLLQLDASLAEFQLSEFQAAVSAAEIQLTEATRLYKEVLALSKTQVVTETLIAQRKAAVAASEATLNRQLASQGLQQERVARHTVFAPFDGVVAMRNADIGEWVQPQSSVFNLVSNTNLRLRLAVPQEYFGEVVQDRTSAIVSPDGSHNQSFSLVISDVVAVSDAITRTFTVLIDLPASPQLIAGMSAEAAIQLSTDVEVLLWLPRSAIKVHPDGGSSVFSVASNRVTRHIVNIAQRRGNLLAVTGAPAGLDYVAKGVELLKNQDEVKVREKP